VVAFVPDPCGVDGVHFGTRTRRWPCEPEGAGILPTGGVVPDPSSLSAVLAQPARPGGVRPDGAGPQQRV